MYKEDFVKDSIEQLFFRFWDNELSREEATNLLARYHSKEDLINFIFTLHGKGKLQGVCYP
jgi:Mg/Co/Ni transporter MgtE